MMSQLQLSPEKLRTIQTLRGQIRRAETFSRNDDGTVISSGCEAMDSMLPAGGYNRGTIIEWHAAAGSAADFFSLLAARNAAQDGGALVIVDPHGHFYPPAARAIGINLANLIVLTQQPKRQPEYQPKYQPEAQASGHSSACNIPSTNSHSQTRSLRPPVIDSHSDFLWSIDQSLRCSAVAAVWGVLPQFETPQAANHWQRRFQLSAESSGCCGMFVCQSQGKTKTTNTAASWAEIQWQLRPLHSHNHAGDTRWIRAKLARGRGAVTGQNIDLEINTITGNVRQAQREHATSNQPTPYSLPLATMLAHPKTRRHTKRA